MNPITPAFLLILVTVCALLLMALLIAAFRREMKQTKPPKLGDVSGVDVTAHVEIGETFDFVSHQKIAVNDVIGITRRRYDIPYGLGQIVSTDGAGLYTARRID
jgi:hypothetical protein